MHICFTPQIGFFADVAPMCTLVSLHRFFVIYILLTWHSCAHQFHSTDFLLYIFFVYVAPMCTLVSLHRFFVIYFFLVHVAIFNKITFIYNDVAILCTLVSLHRFFVIYIFCIRGNFVHISFTPQIFCYLTSIILCYWKTLLCY